MVGSNSEVIVLYDIPSNNPKYKTWSPNTGKARLALSYKGIPFRTEWVEWPDIETICLKIGAPPTSKKRDGRPHYTLPVIYDPSTQRVVADSFVIAKYLDITYPNTPTLFPPGTDALQAVFIDALRMATGKTLFAVIIVRACAALGPRSSEDFRKKSEAAFGTKLEALGGEAQWTTLEEGLRTVDRWLNANGPGRDELLMGDSVCFCDLQLAASLYWARLCCGDDSEDWRRIAGWNGGKWKRIVETFDKYAVADD